MKKLLLISAGLIILLTGCGHTEEVTEEKTQDFVVKTIEVDSTQFENIKDKELEDTKLEAVGNYSGSGTAVRIYDEDGFYHKVEADLEAPAEGKFYEGWLVKSSPSLEFFSTGKMELVDGEYVLEYNSDEDKSSFNEVVITEETEADGLDGKPEAHVLEGEFVI